MAGTPPQPHKLPKLITQSMRDSYWARVVDRFHDCLQWYMHWTVQVLWWIRKQLVWSAYLASLQSFDMYRSLWWEQVLIRMVALFYDKEIWIKSTICIEHTWKKIWRKIIQELRLLVTPQMDTVLNVHHSWLASFIYVEAINSPYTSKLQLLVIEHH